MSSLAIAIFCLGAISLACCASRVEFAPVVQAAESQASADLPRIINAEKSNGLGVNAYKEKNYAKAITFYKDALAVDPKNGSYLNNLALALYKSRNFVESIDVSKSAALLSGSDSQKASAFYNMGLAYQEMSDLSSALAAYQSSCDTQSSEVRCGKVKDMVYAIEKQNEYNLLLEKMKLIPMPVFSEQWERFKCDDVISDLAGGKGVIFVNPEYASDSIEDKPFSDLSKKVGSSIQVSTGYLLGNLEGNSIEYKGRSNFRLYNLDIIVNAENEKEYVFFGDEWSGKSRYKIFMKDKKKDKNSLSLIGVLDAAETKKRWY